MARFHRVGRYVFNLDLVTRVVDVWDDKTPRRPTGEVRVYDVSDHEASVTLKGQDAVEFLALLTGPEGPPKKRPPKFS